MNSYLIKYRCTIVENPDRLVLELFFCMTTLKNQGVMNPNILSFIAFLSTSDLTKVFRRKMICGPLPSLPLCSSMIN
jgi:hypothetical protein